MTPGVYGYNVFQLLKSHIDEIYSKVNIIIRIYDLKSGHRFLGDYRRKDETKKRGESPS